MCVVMKPSKMQTKVLHEQEQEQEQEGATQQTSTVGSRGKTLLPNIVSLLKSKDAAAATATDGINVSPIVGRNDSAHLVEETTTTTTTTTTTKDSSSDDMECDGPKDRTASESAAEEVAEELAMIARSAPAKPTEAAKPTEVAVLPVIVSMSTIAASHHSTNVTLTGTPQVASASSFSVGTVSESGIPGQTKKKSASRRKKGRTMMVDHTYHEHMNDLPPAEMYRSGGAKKLSSGGSGVTTRSSGGGGSKQSSSSHCQNVRAKARGGVQHPFPAKLHLVLDEMAKNGHTDTMSWMPHGRCFMVKDPKEFVKDYMPTYFNQHKFASFQRQLNLYGFKRLTGDGPDRGAYYHELFLRGKPYLGYNIKRVRIKGTGVRAASNPDGEPDFYQMPYCFGDGSASAYVRLHRPSIAEPAPIDPKDAVAKDSDDGKDPPAKAKPDTSSCHSESEPPVLERSSPLLSPEISPPPSPTTMSEKPLSGLPEKRMPIKKRKLAKSAKQTSSRKKTKTTMASQKKNVCINPVTMQIVSSTPYSGRSPTAKTDDTSSLADFESTIRPLEADKTACRSTQQDDGIDEVSFCGCHFHYMGHLNRDALNEIEAFHPPDSIAIPASLASVNADMDVPYLAPNMFGSLTVPMVATAHQITPSSSTEQVPLCSQCGDARPLFASGKMTEPNWPNFRAPVLSRHVSFEDHEHDGDYKGAVKAESKKAIVAEYSEPHRSAKEEMDHFFESFDLPYDWLSDQDIEEHEMMNLDSDEKLAAALEEVIN